MITSALPFLACSTLLMMLCMVFTGLSILVGWAPVAWTYWPTIFTSSGAEVVKILAFLAVGGSLVSSLGLSESFLFFIPSETPACSLIGRPLFSSLVGVTDL